MPSASSTPISGTPPLSPLSLFKSPHLSPTSTSKPPSAAHPQTSPPHHSLLAVSTPLSSTALGLEAGPSVKQARGRKLELETATMEVPSSLLPARHHPDSGHEPADNEVVPTAEAFNSTIHAGPSLRRSKRKGQKDEEEERLDPLPATLASANRSSKRRKLGVKPASSTLPPSDSGISDVNVALSQADADHSDPLLLEAATKGQLPTEVLEHIFLDALERSPDEKRMYTRKPLAALHTFGKVCRRWRNIIRGYPPLWAKVLDPREPSVKAFKQVLRRSGKLAPLKISVEKVECASLCTRQWRDTLACMKRIVHLDIGLSGERKQKGLSILEDALETEAPELESLCIAFEADTSAGAVQGDLSVSLTPSPNNRLFAGYAPKLKSLSFLNCALVSVDSKLNGVLGNLVHLKIDNRLRDCLDLDHALRWWDLCRSGALPFLETLSFRFLQRWILAPNPRKKHARTPLRRGALPPKLKFLGLEGELEPCVSFLNLMDVPASCSVELAVEVDDPTRLAPNDGRIFGPQNEPAELVSSLSRLWRENTTSCLELGIAVNWDETLRLSHRSAERQIEVIIEPSYVGEDVQQMQAHGGPWNISDFYHHFFDHLSRPEHLPDLPAEALLTLNMGMTSQSAPIVDSTFAKFMMQLRSVTRLRLMQLFPRVLVGGQTRYLFDLILGDLDGPPILPTDASFASVALPSVRHMRVPHFWLCKPGAERLTQFIAGRCLPGESFTLVGESVEALVT